MTAGRWLRAAAGGSAVVVTACFGGDAEPTTGQLMQEAEAALEAGDYAQYYESARLAVQTMEPGVLNRPFAMYHLARAAVLTDRPEQAEGLFHTMLDENIEGFMFNYAEVDPVFDSVGTGGLFATVRGRIEGLEFPVRSLVGPLHVIHGAGPNVIASVGSDGVLLIDTGYRLAGQGLRRAVSGLGRSSVDVIVNTHVHEDHVGANETFGETATIIAHTATARAMTGEQEFIPGVNVPPKPVRALPDVTVSSDTTFSFNGELIRIVAAPAHTTGDLVVLFTESNVLHMGDVFFPTSGSGMVFPGSDPDRFFMAVDGILEGLTDEVRVVSGHDSVVALPVLRRQLEKARELVDFVRGAVESGDELDPLLARATEQGYPEGWIRYYHGVMTSN